MTQHASLRWAFVLVAVLAGVSAAQPAAPTNLRAVPNYGGQWIELTWRDNSNDETGFEVHRSTDGGGFVKVGQTGANDAKFADASVNDTSEYIYSVAAFNAGGLSPFAAVDFQNLKILWPVAASHELLHGWNDTIGGAAPAGFHEGVDIQRVGNTVAVTAARGGLVATVLDQQNGLVTIRVKVGATGTDEFDEYNHLGAGLSLTPADVNITTVKAGDKLGNIDQSTFFGVNFVDHVHFVAARTLGGAVVQRHPLAIFKAAADKDPGGKLPAFSDHVGTPAGTMLFQQQGAVVGSYLPFDATHPLWGSIDIMAEVADEMGTNPDQNPNALGYWIEARIGTSCLRASNVKSSAAPYRLFDFTSAWFGQGLAGLALSQAIADAGQNHGPLILEGPPLNPEMYPWPNFKHYVVTNTKGTNGALGNVDANEHWNTNAKNDSQPATSAHANYAGKELATKATEARFPDGLYTVHVLAADLIHPFQDLKADVRLENFPPIVCTALPTGNLPSSTTFVSGSISFCEPMDTTIAALSLLAIDNGASVQLAAWSDDRTLIFTADGLKKDTRFTVTVSKNAKDKPGLPGGNELDGDKDGTPGDDFRYSFYVQKN